MVRRRYLSEMSMVAVVAAAVLVCVPSATIAAPSDGTPRTSGYRQTARSATGPKRVAFGFSHRYGNRSNTFTHSASADGPYDLLVDGGTVFTLRNGMNPYRPAGLVYSGPDVGGTGSTPVTPAPGAALLAALGLSMVGFVRRRVGIMPDRPKSTD